MAKPPVNTNYRLGLNRQQLIEAAQIYGKKESTAKKDSTKRLEEYIVNKIGGRGTKVPEFSERQKSDIRKRANSYGVIEAVNLAGYRINKLTGKHDESNYLRLSIMRAFPAFYDHPITNQMIDELISRMSHLDYYSQIAGLTKMDSYMVNILEEYAEELEQQDEQKQEKINDSNYY